MRVDSEDRVQVVDRKAEVRPASWANGAWPTTKGDAAWRRPQPTEIVHHSPAHRLFAPVEKEQTCHAGWQPVPGHLVLESTPSHQTRHA